MILKNGDITSDLLIFCNVLANCRLSRCTSITTGEDGPIPRCKPFKYTYEKEIVIYPFITESFSSIVLFCVYIAGTCQLKML